MVITFWAWGLRVVALADIWQDLASHYRRKHSFTLLLLAAGAASSVAAVLNLFPDIVQLIANALVGLVAAWVFIADYAKRAAIAHTISLQCNHLDVEYKTLWAGVEHLDEAEARQRLSVLAHKMNDTTQRSGDAGIVDNRRLNEKSEAVAFKTVRERYAT